MAALYSIAFCVKKLMYGPCRYITRSSGIKLRSLLYADPKEA